MATETPSHSLQDLIAQAHGTPEGFSVQSEPLKAAVADVIKAQNEKLKGIYASMLSSFSEGLDARVRTLRKTRAKEKEQAADLARFSRAFRYFADRDNPFPVYAVMDCRYRAESICESLGIPIPAEDSDAWQVPADWQDPSETGSKAGK